MIGLRDPVSEDAMLTQRHKDEYTICQTLRDIYALVSDLEIEKKLDAKLQLRVAMSMAQSMSKKLVKYKQEELKKTKELRND